MSRVDPIRKLPHPDSRAGQEAVRRTVDALRSTGRPACDASLPPEGMFVDRKVPSSDLMERANPSAAVGDVDELVVQRKPRRELKDLVLDAGVRADLVEFIDEFSQTALLRAHSLEPRHKVLLVGAPGNGKTSLAEALAFEAGLQFLTVRYDALVNSFLGETSSRLRRLMDYATKVPCLLFFDEFDSIGKERGDPQDVGEIKRVVGSLLVQLDTMASHTMVVCATNHPELLDRAVWRRFELRLSVNPPDASELVEWFSRLQNSLRADLGSWADTFVKTMNGSSFSEVEAFTLDVRRKLVLSQGKLTPDSALSDALGRWSRRLHSEDMAEKHGLTTNSQVAQGTGSRAKIHRAKAKVPPGALL